VAHQETRLVSASEEQLAELVWHFHVGNGWLSRPAGGGHLMRHRHRQIGRLHHVAHCVARRVVAVARLAGAGTGVDRIVETLVAPRTRGPKDDGLGGCAGQASASISISAATSKGRPASASASTSKGRPGLRPRLRPRKVGRASALPRSVGRGQGTSNLRTVVLPSDRGG
jgi:hypothetical protein